MLLIDLCERQNEAFGFGKIERDQPCLAVLNSERGQKPTPITSKSRAKLDTPMPEHKWK